MHVDPTSRACAAAGLCAVLTGGCFLLSMGVGGTPEPVIAGSWVPLFDGNSLDGWRPAEGDGARGWRVEGEALVYAPPGLGERANADLDSLTPDCRGFDVHLEFKLSPAAESGVRLRGRHEVRLADSFGKGPSARSCGAMLGGPAPLKSAERRAGEWQTLDVSIAADILTATLNGHLIHDRVDLGRVQPAPGARTGRFVPLISLRDSGHLGDAGRVEFRNLRWRRML